MIKQLKFQRLLAMIYIGGALGVLHFWWQFLGGNLFVMTDMLVLMPDFNAYYLWECSFLVPEMLMVVGMMFSAIPLWTNRWLKHGRILALVSATVALFLGFKGITYGFSSGLYGLKHSYAGVILEADISIAAVGLIALLILFFTPRVSE